MINEVFAAWMIFASDTPSIPFNSIEECKQAQHDIGSAGWSEHQVICVHGKATDKEACHD
jgi:hypothetical protein